MLKKRVIIGIDITAILVASLFTATKVYDFYQAIGGTLPNENEIVHVDVKNLPEDVSYYCVLYNNYYDEKVSSYGGNEDKFKEEIIKVYGDIEKFKVSILTQIIEQKESIDTDDAKVKAQEIIKQGGL